MAKKKEWKEGEIVLTFGLKMLIKPTKLMKEWLNVEMPILEGRELGNFEDLANKAHKINIWNEESLKMKFISPVLELGRVLEEEGFVSFFEKKLAAKVKNYKLSVKADFVIGSGLMDYMEKPYFHFQEYKPDKHPTGDSMAQLLEAFLIAQHENADGKPLYGCEVNGAIWKFVIMENDTYCVSQSYDSSKKEDLLQIIAILRKFRHILETVLLK
ncbi:MAG: hypothetical protein EAZ97_09815 [Bacteroidetes bacterium]|nr:MAG: hypothetical protein EAZ97_09815 [Bacteroidota bacterium]